MPHQHLFIEAPGGLLMASSQLVNRLADSIIKHGDKHYKNAKAERLISKNDLLQSVELANGERINGKNLYQTLIGTAPVHDRFPEVN